MFYRNSVRLCVALSITLILHVVPAAAQVDRASLTGTVTDATGAVIVGAKVRVTHEGSGLEREGEVGTGGAYMIPQLPIGIYTVKIEAAGFRSVQFDKVQLLVGQTRTLDAKLDIATAATAIEVRDIGRGSGPLFGGNRHRGSVHASFRTAHQRAELGQPDGAGGRRGEHRRGFSGRRPVRRPGQRRQQLDLRRRRQHRHQGSHLRHRRAAGGQHGLHRGVQGEFLAVFGRFRRRHGRAGPPGVEERLQPVSRRAVRVLPQQRARRAHHLRRSQAGALPPESVRRQHRRPHQSRTSCSSSETTKVCGSGRVRSTPTACPARRCAAG